MTQHLPPSQSRQFHAESRRPDYSARHCPGPPTAPTGPEPGAVHRVGQPLTHSWHDVDIGE